MFKTPHLPASAYPHQRRSIDGEAGLAGTGDHVVTTHQHIVNRAEPVHVVTGIAHALDLAEHGAEIDRAITGLLVDLVGPVIVGKPDLVAQAEIHRVDEIGNSHPRKEMRVVRCE